MYKIELTDTVIQCLFDIEQFKTITLKNSSAAAEFTDSLVKCVTDKIKRSPKLYKHNITLADYGLSVRELIYDNHRALFEINEQTKTIYILLILHTRQDLIKALYRHQTIYLDPL